MMSPERAALHALFDKEWEDRLERSPSLATSVGDHRANDRLNDISVEAIEAQAEYRRGILEELAAIDLSGLSQTDRINAKIFERQMRNSVADAEFGEYRIPLNADSGFHMGFARLARGMPLDSVKGYEDYISRMNATPAYFQQQIEHMRTGLEEGFSLPRRTLLGYEETIEPHIVGDSEESVFFQPFSDFPRAVPEAQRSRLAEEGKKAIRESVVPSYQALLDFFVNEYVPNTRESFGASELPNGREYYQQQIREYTTLELTPEEVHQIGLDEVARIRGEMEEIIEEVGHQGDFASFLEFLRTDPRFFPKTELELLEKASYIAKKMDGKLPSLFGYLPRVPYTVEPVPAHIAPKYTAGRYVGPPFGSTEPGIYWVNTAKLETRTLYTLEALSLHEAVPGHHLQGAIAREQGDQPNFRRFSYISAYGEGWGLYSEYLGLEAGFYTDPYSNFGRLTYEMWRACRLVVDTGVHAMGWTRQQMIDYMAENTALSLHEITTETDRYITWPGQALAYKLGEIEIRKLRKKAEQALGENFDVRDFHDAVLRHGSVPLPILTELIDDYIAEAS